MGFSNRTKCAIRIPGSERRSDETLSRVELGVRVFGMPGLQAGGDMRADEVASAFDQSR